MWSKLCVAQEKWLKFHYDWVEASRDIQGFQGQQEALLLLIAGSSSKSEQQNVRRIVEGKDSCDWWSKSESFNRKFWKSWTAILKNEFSFSSHRQMGDWFSQPTTCKNGIQPLEDQSIPEEEPGECHRPGAFEDQSQDVKIYAQAGENVFGQSEIQLDS